MNKEINNRQFQFMDSINRLNLESQRTFKFARKTFGCQMNENDSEKIAGMLVQMGYVETEDFEEADLIFFNTCCVRENAEEKTFGWIGTLKTIKKKNPNLIVCVTGCMMQEAHIVSKIKKSYRHVDILLGTHNFHTLPEAIYNVRINKKKHYRILEENKDIIEIPYISRTEKFRAYVTIIQGCNNFCSYCIVPYVRGREKSRSKEKILEEIKMLANDGCKEVTLLGQNVNSYGNDWNEKNAFASLLREVAKIDGIEWIRFMTSHPKDLSDELIMTIKECDKICNNVHLPLQAGSTRILKEMNRGYTKEKYLNLANKIKNEIEDVTITTDIIVGFPSESREDFLETLDVVKKVRYDNAYMFIYSKRKGTKAYERDDFIPISEAKNNFNDLLEAQHKISYEKNLKMLGKTYKVLVEGISKNDETMLSGRTEGNKLVHFKGDVSLTGEFINAKITNVKSFSLEGEIVCE